MSRPFEIIFTKQQLLPAIPNLFGWDIYYKAQDNDDNAMNTIGCMYKERLEYVTAMAWFRLAAAENNPRAQNNIGLLYCYGYGVRQDGLLAIEWYLKAAVQGLKTAWENLGFSFESGKGVPVNKQKALEWYYKCNEKPDAIKALTELGIELSKADRTKCIRQLIIETENIVQIERHKKDETIDALIKLKVEMEKESNAKDEKIKSLEDAVQALKDTLK